MTWKYLCAIGTKLQDKLPTYSSKRVTNTGPSYILILPTMPTGSSVNTAGFVQNPEYVSTIQIGPFLKLYNQYIDSYERTKKKFHDAMKSHKDFANQVEEFQARPSCKGLTLPHHMLTPIQRFIRVTVGQSVGPLIGCSVIQFIF